MSTNSTPIDVQQRCAEAKNNGQSNRTIYETIYRPSVENPMPYRSFMTVIARWSRRLYPSRLTLEQGTYEGFIANNATVQVNGSGEIVQAWIKQTADSFDSESFIEAISTKIEPYTHSMVDSELAENMLEIPLFDMHWGIANFDYYAPILDEIINTISLHRWQKIVIPFGQDFFHNDSIVDGRTTKGTKIEKVDMKRAVKEGQRFMYALIDAAIANSNEVKILYTPGNHDRSISWMFMQVLLARYGAAIVDDEMLFRRVIHYGDNSIMITHGDSRNATVANLAHIFPIAFPNEFAEASTREVHAGHVHHETDSDIFGVMVRRLSTGNITDEWSNSEDYIGSHKRFMLFEWGPKKLKAIHYI